MTVPEDYAHRLTQLFPGAFDRLQLMSLEAHDLALSKLERNSGRDREDIRFLAHAAPLDLALLKAGTGWNSGPISLIRNGTT